jgi:hypothetical protein
MDMNVPAFDHYCAIVLLLLEEGRLLDVGGHGSGEVKFGVWVLLCFWGSRGELQADACGG